MGLFTQQEDTVTDRKQLLQLAALKHKLLRVLHVAIYTHSGHDLLERLIPLRGDVHVREQVIDETQEDRHVYFGDLRHVEVSQGSHQEG